MNNSNEVNKVVNNKSSSSLVTNTSQEFKIDSNIKPIVEQQQQKQLVVNEKSDKIINNKKPVQPIKKIETTELLSSEVKNLMQRSGKLSAKFGEIDDASISNFNLNNMSLKLHGLETEV